MKYIIILVVCFFIFLITSLILVYKTYKEVKTNKSNKRIIGFNIILVSLLIFIMCILFFSSTYNYSYQKSTVLIDQGKYREAIDFAEKALAIRDKAGKLSKLLDKTYFGVPLFFYSERLVRMTLANNYKRLKEYQKANNEYLAIVSINSNDFDAIAGVAECYFLMRNMDMAKHYYQKLITIQLDIKDYAYYFEMGRAYFVLEDYENAIRYLIKSRELGMEKEMVNRLLEICYKKINHNERNKQ